MGTRCRFGLGQQFAGTTFVNHLQRQFAADTIYPSAKVDRRFPTDVEPKISIPFLLSLPPERHRSIQVYAGHFPYMVCELLNRDLVTFTILRDPVALYSDVRRTISSFEAS